MDDSNQMVSQIVAGETGIVMTDKQFEYFCDMLDNPPAENIARMAKLLDKKTLVDA